jgi:two-component system heavy metal sensor histidine kinase CusS
MPRRSIARRLALASFVGVAAILAGLGFFLLRAAETHFAELDREELAAKLRTVAAVLENLSDDARRERLPEALARVRAWQGEFFLRVEPAGGGAVLLADPPLAERPPRPAAAPSALADLAVHGTHHPGPAPAVFAFEAGGKLYRGMAAVTAAGTDGQVLAVWIAIDIEHHRAFMALFRTALWTAVLIAMLLALPLALVATRWGLAPLKRFEGLARAVSAASLAARVDTAELPRELAGLGAEFNRMLARLEEGFRRLSAFSSDIAHELRTPVSNLMLETEVALSRARSAEEYREVLYSNLEEYARMSRMISDMLFLARADNGLVVPACETVDLAALAAGLVEFFEAAAQDRGLSLLAEGGAQVTGDPLMLRRAVSNLLSNAVRHATPGSSVAIRIAAAHDGTVAVTVDNQGDTIPAKHLPRLFDRFYQVDAARSGEHDSSGLGLAITRSIVEAHGGTAAAESADGHTRITLRLPRTAGGHRKTDTLSA